ncbi:MAG: RES family NAD+ phosphorylase [Burkholderiales bacterium]
MNVVVWRIAADTPQYTADDLTGSGAALTGARWNAPGEAVNYAATSIALAAWETRVHIGRTPALPLNRYLVRIDLPDTLWAAAERLTAPAVGWDAVPPGRVSIDFGSRWLAEQRSAVLRVPSVVVPEEDNVLINPAHPQVLALARPIMATKLRKFVYDPRV